MQLDHERLDVYRTSIRFVVVTAQVIAELPAGNGYLADQLHRAGISISLNIAEGAGEFSGGDKARFYRMAKRSATECAAIADVLKELSLIRADLAGECRHLLISIVSMLVKLIKAQGGS